MDSITKTEEINELIEESIKIRTSEVELIKKNLKIKQKKLN